jgi:hypothetical protein
MGCLMLAWLVGLRLLPKWKPKLFWLAAMGPISACFIGEARRQHRTTPAPCPPHYQRWLAVPPLCMTAWAPHARTPPWQASSSSSLASFTRASSRSSAPFRQACRH